MNAQRGFTLVEIVMVIVIMGALSAIAVTRFNVSTFEAEAASVELVAAIRYAQEKSMSNSGAPNYQVEIDSVAKRYTVTQAGVNIIHPLTGVAPYQSNWTNVTLAPVGTSTISFDGYGTPTLTGPLTFVGNQAVVTVTVASDADNVTIEQMTGFTR